MKIDDNLRAQVRAICAPLAKQPAKQFPAIASLSMKLEEILPQEKTAVISVVVPPQLAAMFATSAIEVWLRAVHSFLISASLVKVSPIWSSVSGYYSSHYSVRAIAHMLGFFQMFKRKRIVRLSKVGKQFHCEFSRKDAHDREHQFYWEIVKKTPTFATDPFFTVNDTSADASDVGHRDRANYADHIGNFPSFHPLDEQSLKLRIGFISSMEIMSPPLPKRSMFPDVDSVHLMAYHRLVRVRRLLDEVLGTESNFWNVHRNPSWTSKFVNFQLTEARTLGPE